MDGGSTDNSVEIIKKYEKHLAYWVSEKDGGQSAAINAGFGRSTGDILGWLNSDDMYLPGALLTASKHLDTTKAGVVFGNCIHLQENSKHIHGSDVAKQHQNIDLSVHDYIIQPSAFWTKHTWRLVGLLDAGLTYTFDWDWFLRAKHLGIDFLPVPKYLSIYRLHKAHKTGTGGGKRQTEIADIYERYAGIAHKNLYLECCRNSGAIDSLTSSLHSARLHRFLPAILRCKYPQLFRGKNSEIIWSMMGMR